MNKICTKCKESKPVTGFYRHSLYADKFVSQCKACMGISSKKWKKTPKGKKKITEYLQSSKGKEKNQKGVARWKTKNPIKINVYQIVKLRIKQGIIVKSPCETCGGVKVHAHHDDYAKPLEVRWLCPTHHRKWHKENGAGING